MKNGAVAAACVAVSLADALPRQNAASPPQSGAPTALARLARVVTGQLLDAQSEPPVAVWVVGESPELARDFGAVFVSELAIRKLGPVALSSPSSDSAEAAARERGARSLVRLTLSLSLGSLHARGDLISTWVNFWSGRAATRSALPSSVLDASVEADAQALSLASLSPRPSAEFRLEGAKFADLPSWPSAIAAGDLDGDGRDEVVALTDAEVFAFSSDGQLLARRDHRQLGDSPTPCREPFGAIWVQAQRVAYFSAARKAGELLALDRARGEFVVVGSLSRVPIAADGSTEIWGSFVPGESAFAPEVHSSSGERWSLRGPFWTLALHGPPTRRTSLVAYADGAATWSDESGSAYSMRDAAAAMALIDVDGDGRPELVASSPSFRPELEEVRVRTLTGSVGAHSRSADAGAERGDVRWRVSVRAGWALQIAGAHLGPGEGTQILVGVWKPDGSGELQLVRPVHR